MSVGYDFEPEWFACGQSPLCVEVDRLVKSGVVVVVAAGNTGFGYQNHRARGHVSAGIDLTINDPGNAELAITVGLHPPRDAAHLRRLVLLLQGPHRRRPAKPDLVAPGEKDDLVRRGTRATRKRAQSGRPDSVDYVERAARAWPRRTCRA